MIGREDDFDSRRVAFNNEPPYLIGAGIDAKSKSVASNRMGSLASLAATVGSEQTQRYVKFVPNCCADSTRREFCCIRVSDGSSTSTVLGLSASAAQSATSVLPFRTP